MALTSGTKDEIGTVAKHPSSRHDEARALARDLSGAESVWWDEMPAVHSFGDRT
jgi:hypothetical protein